jgi:hypothetical protein
MLLWAALVALCSMLPSCRSRQDQGDFLKVETDRIRDLTIPSGSYPANDPDKPIIPGGATAAWEFDTAMSSEAYAHWVSSRLEPALRLQAESQDKLLFSGYLNGDAETIRIEISSHSGREHVRVTVDLYPD